LLLLNPLLEDAFLLIFLLSLLLNFLLVLGATEIAFVLEGFLLLDMRFEPLGLELLLLTPLLEDAFLLIFWLSLLLNFLLVLGATATEIAFALEGFLLLDIRFETLPLELLPPRNLPLVDRPEAITFPLLPFSVELSLLFLPALFNPLS